LLSIFFIVLARLYSTEDFGNYIIANTIYSFVLGFSSLGLGHWFIREFLNNKEDRKSLTEKFLKIQLLVGIIFYLINVAMTFIIYKSELIRSLSLIIGINIIFDNIINAIKSLNIANLEQRKTFYLLIVEAFLKFLIACCLFFYKIDIFYLSFLLILIRLITLNLFIKIGSSSNFTLKELISVKINWIEIKKIIFSNWFFIVISSISTVNWRIGNIIVSKVLTLKDVANYEVSFKLLSIAYILPIIVSSSIYPMMINAYKINKDDLKKLYKKIFYLFYLYGLLSYTFIFSYSDYIIPLLFGSKFMDTAQYCKQMFLVMLVFPTVFLQASMLLTMKLEKADMYCNLICVSINIFICIFGLMFYRNLFIVNLAIFVSFFIFHLIQDIILFTKKIMSKSHILYFYTITALVVLLYIYFSNIIKVEYLFFIFWTVIILILIYHKKKIISFYTK
jgi:O-antigen/teichoic acid export membrane protein